MVDIRSRDTILEAIEKDEPRDKFGMRLGGFREQIRWIEKEYARLKPIAPSLQKWTVDDFFKWRGRGVKAFMEDIQRERAHCAKTTPEQFWNAAYSYDPFGTSTSAHDSELFRLLSSCSVKPIALGKVYANTALWLLPGSNSLPMSNFDIPGGKPYSTLPFADTDSGALSYPDNHSSSDYEEGGSHHMFEMRPEESSQLTRFIPLGWVAEKRGDSTWERTGHIFFMDVDRGRDHHPWLVLASEWLDSNDSNDTFTTIAEPKPKRGDPDVHGVFPGNSKRTVVAKLCHMRDEKIKSPEPFLKQLKAGFDFDLWRRGGDRTAVKSLKSESFHPDLVRVMGWHWDEKNKQEVCYAEDGAELYRLNRSTRNYQIPELEKVPVVG